jgi:hypothetical protein
MKQQNKRELPEKLEHLRRDFEAWREKRRKGERIPELLWAAATRIVEECGLSRVSGTLGLDYYKLKERSGLSEKEPEGQPESGLLFTELTEPVLNVGTVCVVELEKSNGARMRIGLAERATVDWGRLTEAFLKA